MTAEQLVDYALTKPGATLAWPFGPTPLCVKVGGRLFLQVYAGKDRRQVTLSCDRVTGECYRLQYPERVRPGYHCPPVQRPYFNTISLEEGIPDAELLNMVDHAYRVVVGKLTKKAREALAGQPHLNT